MYLYRWEWNRALISGVIFLAAEIAVIGWALNSKLSESRPPGRRDPCPPHRRPPRRGSQPTLNRLRLAPSPSDKFNVFVPILLGAGLHPVGLSRGWSSGSAAPPLDV